MQSSEFQTDVIRCVFLVCLLPPALSNKFVHLLMLQPPPFKPEDSFFLFFTLPESNLIGTWSDVGLRIGCIVARLNLVFHSGETNTLSNFAILSSTLILDHVYRCSVIGILINPKFEISSLNLPLSRLFRSLPFLSSENLTMLKSPPMIQGPDLHDLTLNISLHRSAWCPL